MFQPRIFSFNSSHIDFADQMVFWGNIALSYQLSGVKKENIVLGFQAPQMPQYREYGIN
jgi:hypothetical protein